MTRQSPSLNLFPAEPELLEGGWEGALAAKAAIPRGSTRGISQTGRLQGGNMLENCPDEMHLWTFPYDRPCIVGSSCRNIAIVTVTFKERRVFSNAIHSQRMF